MTSAATIPVLHNVGQSGPLWTFFANAPLPKITVFSLFSTLKGQTLQKMWPTAHPSPRTYERRPLYFPTLRRTSSFRSLVRMGLAPRTELREPSVRPGAPRKLQFFAVRRFIGAAHLAQIAGRSLQRGVRGVMAATSRATSRWCPLASPPDQPLSPPFVPIMRRKVSVTPPSEKILSASTMPTPIRRVYVHSYN